MWQLDQQAPRKQQLKEHFGSTYDMSLSYLIGQEPVS